ncbi:MAG: NAD-dependent epimerase/dehydratase family protein [Clostridia bacterium]|nr:NAD-dependent epimerase/dehydratase family protein [Clostridia bacterium]
MKILVTGGAGYVGSNVILQLLERGHEVVVADNFSNTGDNLKKIEKALGREIKLYDIDLCNRDETLKMFEKEKFDGVIHLASKKYIPESKIIPSEYMRVNITSTINVLDAMDMYGVNKLAFASTVQVYGKPKSLPVRENAEKEPTSPYAESKLLCERIIEDYAKLNDKFNVSIFRFANLVGSNEEFDVGDILNAKYKPVLSYLSLSVLDGKEITVNGGDIGTKDGTYERDFIDVRDLSRVVVDVFEKNNQLGVETFNVANNETSSVMELASALLKISKSKQTLHMNFDNARKDEPVTLYYSNDKIKDLVGYERRYSLEDSVKAQYEYVKNRHTENEITKK